VIVTSVRDRRRWRLETATFVAVTPTTNPDVTWSITPRYRKIEKIDLITARYTAPDKIGEKKIVTTTASAADPTKSGTATIELNCNSTATR
jgi:hypothetical protein